MAVILHTSRTAPSTIAPTQPRFCAAVESSSPQIPDRIEPAAAAIRHVVRPAGIDRLQLQRVRLRIYVRHVRPQRRPAAADEQPIHGQRAERQPRRLVRGRPMRVQHIADDGACTSCRASSAA